MLDVHTAWETYKPASLPDSNMEAERYIPRRDREEIPGRSHVGAEDQLADQDAALSQRDQEESFRCRCAFADGHHSGQGWAIAKRR